MINKVEELCIAFCTLTGVLFWKHRYGRYPRLGGVVKGGRSLLCMPLEVR